MRRRLLFFGVAVVLAGMLASVAFAAIVVPFDRFPGSERFQYLFLALDAPVSVLNRVVPDDYRTHLTYVIRCNHTYCFPDRVPVETARYLRVGMPAYMLLFYLPSACVAVARARKRRKPAPGRQD